MNASFFVFQKKCGRLPRCVRRKERHPRLCGDARRILCCGPIRGPSVVSGDSKPHSRFHVERENSTRIGKISSLPMSISRISTTFDTTLNAA